MKLLCRMDESAPPAAPAAGPSASGVWLVTITLLPVEDPAARMRVLRTLESLGAAVMREGAYLLPDTPGNRQSLEALTDYIVKVAGVAHVLQVSAGSPAQQVTFTRLFDRSARYEDLIKTVESLRVGFGHSDPSAISRVVHKQRREFESIAALDFFPTASRERAQQTLARADAEVRKLLFPTKSQPSLAPGETLLARTWATRKPLWADRLACAWLIRRFVDPEATVVWLERSEGAPSGAISFGYEGAQFANSEARVTYEEMLAKLDLAKNPALVKIGSIVHFLEVRGAPVAEAAGVQTLLQGAQRRSGNEAELLAEAEKTFDLLYEAYYQPPKE
ncbi:MAG: chromate resistance protein ChrB domain-containing protein [Burkholderiales bacterium]